MAVLPGMQGGRLSADDDFAVVEGDDIGRPFNIHKIGMDPGNGAIGNKHDGHFLQCTKMESLIIGNLETLRKCNGSGPANPTGIQGDEALAIGQDQPGCRTR